MLIIHYEGLKHFNNDGGFLPGGPGKKQADQLGWFMMGAGIMEITPKNIPDVRIKNFEMVEKCFSENQAKQESERCLRCDLRLEILPVTFPPDKWLDLNEENVSEVPAVEGVYQLRDENKVIIVIKGTQDIQADLKEKLSSDSKARYFWFEPDPMYTKRK